MDRVVLAVDKTNFNVPAATKATPVYQQVQDKAIMAHFGAGLRDSISKTILGAANPPDSVSGMLLAAKAVEAEAAKIGAPGTSALAVGEDAKSEDQPSKKSEVTELTEKLEAVMAAMTKAKDKATQKCSGITAANVADNRLQVSHPDSVLPVATPPMELAPVVISHAPLGLPFQGTVVEDAAAAVSSAARASTPSNCCLLYTSDAADE